jgi:hypothetical protein
MLIRSDVLHYQTSLPYLWSERENSRMGKGIGPLFDMDQSCFFALDKPCMHNPYAILPQLPLAEAASSPIPSSSRSKPYVID